VKVDDGKIVGYLVDVILILPYVISKFKIYEFSHGNHVYFLILVNFLAPGSYSGSLSSTRIRIQENKINADPDSHLDWKQLRY
jgi:hypothetical protein